MRDIEGLGRPGLDEEDLSVGSVIRVMRKRRRIIATIALACGLLAVLTTLVLRPHYKSTAEIEIEQDQVNPLQSSLGSVAVPGAIPDDAKTQTQTEVFVLQSDDLALEAMEQTHYETHLGQKRVADEIGLPLTRATETRKQLLKSFSQHLSVKPVEGTRLVQVSFTDTDPTFAASTVMTLLHLYVHQRLLRKNASTAQATEWIGDQISSVNKKLETSQQALMDYQRKSGLISLPASEAPAGGAGAAGAGSRSPAVDRLVQLNQSLVAAETDRIAKEAIYRAVAGGDPATLASVAGAQLANNTVQDPAQIAAFNGLVSLRQQQGAVEVQLGSARQTFGAKNPHLLDLLKQNDELARQIREAVKAIVSRAYLDFQTALKNESGLRSAYSIELDQMDDANSKQVHLASLQQEASSNRALYEDLYTKLEQSRLAVGTQASNVSIISNALPPADPAYPQPLLYPLLGLVGGLVLGVLVAFIVEAADSSVTTPSEIERLTGLHVIAAVPLDGRRAGWFGQKILSGAGRGNWLKDAPNGATAEGLRELRTNLIPILTRWSAKTVLVSSPLPSEGRTSTVYNLGVSFALLKRRVLVIEADLREPAMSRYVEGDAVEEKGLSAWLTTDISLTDIILPDLAVPGLAILKAGQAVENSAELLSSPRFADLLAKCRDQYDLVLLDSPALMLATDALVMSEQVDGVLLLARSQSTSSLVLQRAAQQLHRNDAKTFGAVLNGLDTTSSEFLYANGFSGHRGKSRYGSSQS